MVYEEKKGSKLATSRTEFILSGLLIGRHCRLRLLTYYLQDESAEIILNAIPLDAPGAEARARVEGLLIEKHTGLHSKVRALSSNVIEWRPSPGDSTRCSAELGMFALSPLSPGVLSFSSLFLHHSALKPICYVAPLKSHRCHASTACVPAQIMPCFSTRQD